VHGLTRGLEGVCLEGRGMGLEVFFASFREGEGACLLSARILSVLIVWRYLRQFVHEFVKEAEVLCLVAEINVLGLRGPKM
jgi:hypothetical protein